MIVFSVIEYIHAAGFTAQRQVAALDDYIFHTEPPDDRRGLFHVVYRSNAKS